MATELVLDASVSLAWFLKEIPRTRGLRGRGQRGGHASSGTRVAVIALHERRA